MNYINIQKIYKAKDLTIKSNDKEYHFDGLVKSNINEFLGKYNPFDMNLNKINNMKVKKFNKNTQYEDLKVGMYYTDYDIQYRINNIYEVYYVSHKTKSYITIKTITYEKTRIINTQSYYKVEIDSEDKWKYSKAKKGCKKIYLSDCEDLPLWSLYEYNKKDLEECLKNNICNVCVNGGCGNSYINDIYWLMRDNKMRYNEIKQRGDIFENNFRNCGATYKGLLIHSDNETQNLMNYYEVMKFIDMLMFEGQYKKDLTMAKEMLKYEFNKYGKLGYRNRIYYDEVKCIIEKYL